jgi:membrane protein implicated in regulation of membrane protease activity
MITYHKWTRLLLCLGGGLILSGFVLSVIFDVAGLAPEGLPLLFVAMLLIAGASVLLFSAVRWVLRRFEAPRLENDPAAISEEQRQQLVGERWRQRARLVVVFRRQRRLLRSHCAWVASPCISQISASAAAATSEARSSWPSG